MEGRADTPSALPNSLPRRGWIGAKETLANEDGKVKCLYLPATWDGAWVEISMPGLLSPGGGAVS